MLHIPILRQGLPYQSVEQTPILHHATGQPVASLSQANSGLIARDVNRWPHDVLQSFSVAQLLDCCRAAAKLFMNAALPIGDTTQSFDDYITQLSATTGMPITYCRNNAQKIFTVLDAMPAVLAGLTRGFDLSILDSGHGQHEGHTLSFFRQARTLAAVLPSNSPGVHSLWLPAVPLKVPLVLRPGREEPWTPLRIIEAFAAAGVPRAAFGFYPSDHAGAAELLRTSDRSMLFGGASTTRPWHADPRVEIHGPGFSKVLLGPDAADDWQSHIDLIASSIAANGGRSCINASAVWTPRHAPDIAAALAQRFAKVRALPADDPAAEIAAFANPAFANSISATIDQELHTDGAADVTLERRGSSRLVKDGRLAWLLPTIIRCDRPDHPLANREFLFPFASVVQCPTADMPDRIGPSLIVTTLTADPDFTRALMASPHIDRLNIGAIPTWKVGWDQPHEGNLFEHLYRRRAFQSAPMTPRSPDAAATPSALSASRSSRSASPERPE